MYPASTNFAKWAPRLPFVLCVERNSSLNATHSDPSSSAMTATRIFDSSSSFMGRLVAGEHAGEAESTITHQHTGGKHVARILRCEVRDDQRCYEDDATD